uniref:Uncharacterized protein n=1 Tax=Arundo donax TaxID=35708 RepID=A0A0A8YY78_ARUDO
MVQACDEKQEAIKVSEGHGERQHRLELFSSLVLELTVPDVCG